VGWCKAGVEGGKGRGEGRGEKDVVRKNHKKPLWLCVLRETNPEPDRTVIQVKFSVP
jgi:hypothetical protein